MPPNPASPTSTPPPRATPPPNSSSRPFHALTLLFLSLSPSRAHSLPLRPPPSSLLCLRPPQLTPSLPPQQPPSPTYPPFSAHQPLPLPLRFKSRAGRRKCYQAQFDNVCVCVSACVGSERVCVGKDTSVHGSKGNRSAQIRSQRGLSGSGDAIRTPPRVLAGVHRDTSRLEHLSQIEEVDYFTLNALAESVFFLLLFFLLLLSFFLAGASALRQEM